MSSVNSQRTGTAPPGGELLYPQLRARRNASREEVSANQRARLYAAMVEACARHGYRATTVRELVALAGVSKRTPYEYFEGKEDWFLATYDQVVHDVLERIQSAYRAGEAGGQDWSAGLCRAFDAFAAELADRPRQSRLALLDVLAAGPSARDRVEHVEAVFAQMIAQSLAQAPDEVAMPQPVLRSLVGGIWFVTRSRLLRDRPSAIAGSGRELLEWMLTYRDPAVEALPRRAPVPKPPRRDRRRRGEGDERTSLLRVAAELAARGGLPSLTPLQIAQQAGLDPVAFSRHFEDVGDCFFTSLELMSVEAVARALRESEDAPDWATALCRSMRALLCQIAEDPVFARCAFVAIYVAGSSGTRRRADLMRSFAALLARRAPEGNKPSALVAEAIVGSIWSIAHRHVVHDRVLMLPSLWPQATYLALAPIVGAQAALETITSELGSSGSRQGAARQAILDPNS
jgi:AcrR family transcriptional regulator